jgi:hypothetical protein
MWVVNATPRPLYSRKGPLPMYKRLGGPTGPVWTGAENLTSTGIQSRDRPARSESLYRLRYPGPTSVVLNITVCKLVCGREMYSVVLTGPWDLHKTTCQMFAIKQENV